LARRLGIAEQAVYESDEAIARQILASGHPSLKNITLDELKLRGSVRLCYPDPYVPFQTGFPTPSGKLEFVSERMAKEGLDPVAGYTSPCETAQIDTELAREYPLALITPANHYFLNSIFANMPRQRRRSGVTTVVIHPCDASPHIRTGDEVCVTNARGSFHAIAEVDECVRRGVIASTKGSWPCDSTGGSTVNATVDDHTSDMGAGALYHDNRVRIEKVHPTA
jgi:anaerobic selenocysteine-containing dehydrogenase